MKEIFALRLYFTPVREQYKLNLHIIRKKQVDLELKSWEVLVKKFGIVCLTIKSLPKIGTDLKTLLKYGTVPHVVALYVPYRYDK